MTREWVKGLFGMVAEMNRRGVARLAGVGHGEQ